MRQAGAGFQSRVYNLVAHIPKGRVMTYGQIAAFCGSPRAARIVGGVAHRGDQSLPWHRVVHKDGRLATGYPGGVQGHKTHLEAEGVKVNDNYQVAGMTILLWQPEKGWT
jgi:methylated-DNA-protein-cysteine methyltransferase-like protein